MMFRFVWLTLLASVWLFPGMVQAQDSTSNRGTAYGTVRSYLLVEDQAKGYRDHATLALGGWLGYRRMLRDDLTLDAAFYLSNRIWSSDLTITDTATGKYSRYALGLYNVQDPNQQVISMLGKFNLRYAPEMHELTVGRFLAKTPFLNPEDGRMIPSLVQGLRYAIRPTKQWHAQFYYIQALAPRSTGRWYGLDSSLGTYSQGRQLDGSPSDYAGHLSTNGLLVGSVSWHAENWGTYSLWEYRLTNVFNLLYLKSQHRIWDAAPWKLSLATEWFWQEGIGDGGSSTPTQRYLDPDHQALGGGARLQLRRAAWGLSFSGLRIGPQGRFLFPREWGREPFYVFQKRERAEGAGDLWAYVAKLSYQAKPVNISLSYGYQDRTTPQDPELNKYAMGDYHHLNAELVYTRDLSSDTKLNIEFLYTYKWNGLPSATTLQPAWEYNKVNLGLYHLVVNLSF
jgi:hypothetical protein